jgi:hypothetical protein
VLPTFPRGAGRAGSFLHGERVGAFVGAINEDELTRAVEQTLAAQGKIAPDQARPIARMVLNYFGLEDTVLDNKLSSEDRDRFYQLEEEGLLTSEEEDATVSRGKTWRIHYWLLKKDRIRDVGQRTETPVASDAESLYKSIGDREWNRSKGGSAADAPRTP